MSDSQLSHKLKLSKNAVKYRIERLKKNKIIIKFATTVNLSSIGYTTVTILFKFNKDIYQHQEIIEYFKTDPFVAWAATLSGNWDLLAEIVVSGFQDLNQKIKLIQSKFQNDLNSYQVLFSQDTLRVEHLIHDFYKDLNLAELASEPRTTEKHQINLVDKKILSVLSQDASQSFVDIAKLTNTSTDIVRYRLRNLLKKKIIVKFFSEISLHAIGYTEYFYTIQLQSVDNATLQKLRKKIATHNNITFAFFDTNSSTMAFTCAFKDVGGIDSLSRSLRAEYGSMIVNQQYLIIKEHLKFDLFPQGLVQ
jgi:DNA-binding Lrp family transcriptional regulator